MLAGEAPFQARRVSEEPPRPDAAENPSSPQENEQLFATLYAELRRLANRELLRYPGMSVSPTTLVHEVYLNVAGRDGVGFEDPRRFLSYVARAMRGLLIDFMRRQMTQKRGAGFHITELTTQMDGEAIETERLTRLSEALDGLATLDARLAEVVDLKYFCGFSFAEIAALNGASERTVQRDWEKARLLLYDQIGESDA
jgi:RNA polymerase sigma factor (TIGR02999 family)